ncbi:MAG TPA: TetR/AcrR family transcriptional regulator [Anaerolineales bacterium]|nr:TetR/AcrR family transcriptional regulator [Anaerolineales bacterium]
MDTTPLSRHERRRQQTRKLLIETTVQLVLEKGYEAITIQDITDRADLGRGTFYIHFKDKEDVLWTAIQDLIREMESEAHRQFEGKLPKQVEYYGLLNMFRHAEKNRDLYRVVLGGQGSAVLTERVQDLLADVIRRDVENPELRDPNAEPPAEVIAQMMTGLMSRLIGWWLKKGNMYSAEQMAAMTYKVLYRKNPPR